MRANALLLHNEPDERNLFIRAGLVIVDWSDKSPKHPYRFKKTYGPWTYPYVRHYDPQKYKKSMIDYKNGKLKSRPNGLRWCKIRTTLKPGESSSEWDQIREREFIGWDDLERDLKMNKWILSWKIYLNMTRKYRSLHPIFEFIPIVIANPRYSL